MRVHIAGDISKSPRRAYMPAAGTRKHVRHAIMDLIKVHVHISYTFTELASIRATAVSETRLDKDRDGVFSYRHAILMIITPQRRAVRLE